MNMRRLIQNIVVAVAALAVTVVVVDVVAFTVLGIRPAGYHADRFFEFSPHFGHMGRPDASGWYYRYLLGEKFMVHNNRFGYADAPRTLARTRPRIALIGDSTTEFWEADEDDRGQYVLEDSLDGRFEVLNMGMRGYGTDQTLLLFEELGVKFDPDIAVYMVCVNDPADNARRIGKPYFDFVPRHPDSLALHNYPVETPRKWDEYTWIEEHSFVYRLFSEARNALMPGIRLKKLLGKYKPPPPHFELRCYKRDYNDSDRKRMRRTLLLIGMMNDFMKAHGIHLLVVEGLYKPMNDPAVRRGVVGIYGDIFDPDKLTRQLSDYCAENDIAFVSMPRVAQARGVRVSSLMHRSDNMHLDDAGVRFYASVVADTLRRLGWVDARD